MQNSTPQYVAPPPDPGLAILNARNEQQSNIAIQDRVTADTARLMTMYGARMATSGDTNWSPLLMPRAPEQQTTGPMGVTAMTGGIF